MRRASRITLFVQDRDSKVDTFPDAEVFNTLMQQTPLVSRNPDGSRTLVFDLANPIGAIGLPQPQACATGDSLRAKIAALGVEAQALGLPLTTALAESLEIVAEAELNSAGGSAPRS